MGIFKKFLLALIFGAILAAVLNFIEPPKSWGDASTFQILILFIPLLLFFTFFINLFLNYLPRSFAVGLGLLMFSVLKALGSFNLATTTLIALTTALLVWFIPKSRLTKNPKIPKLTLVRKRHPEERKRRRI